MCAADAAGDPSGAAAYEPCPECGGTEREQKFRAVICADCRVVLDDQTPPPLTAASCPEPGCDVVMAATTTHDLRRIVHDHVTNGHTAMSESSRRLTDVGECK